MNPFDLRGPEFLLFYLALGAAVLGVVILRRRRMEPRGPLQRRLTDPLAIAYLRGGKGGATSVACLDLFERGALRGQGDLMYARKDARPAPVAPLESAVLRVAAVPARFSQIVRDPRVREALDLLRLDLEKEGLLPDRVQKVSRWLSGLTGIGLLAGVAWTKVDVALGRGKTNLGFLVILWLLFTILLLWKANPRRTPRGQRVLEDLGELLAKTRDHPPRVKGQTAYVTNDLLLIAAVYGMTALPMSIQNAHARTLPAVGDSTSSWGGCGGGGCGGGGCGGGGCGGCGGGGD